MQFVDPKNDFAFKKIFCNKTKKEILISFLNSIIPDNSADKKIINYEILNINPLFISATTINNNKILILYKYILNNHNFSIDTNIERIGNILKSNNLEWSYFSLYLNIYVNTATKAIFNSSDSYYNIFFTSDKDTGHLDLKYFDCIIELPKFKKELNQLETILDKWIYFIKNVTNLEIIPKEYESLKEFKEAFTIATQYNWNKNELEVYDYMKIKAWDDMNTLSNRA